MLARLVREAGATPGLERLRLSSIEVNHVDDELVRALTETPTVSPHLHVPLQSGDDGVLRAMGRRYTAAQFERRLAPLADLNLTTDVIVGFPAEDDAAFERTLALVERLGMSKAHVFPYSPRPGTRTALDDAVPPDAKRERGARLRALSDELSRRRWHAPCRYGRPRPRRPPRPRLRGRLHALARRERRRRLLRPSAGDRRGGRGGARSCRLSPIASSAASSRRAITFTPRTASSRSATSRRRRRPTFSSCPNGTSTRSATSRPSPTTRPPRCSVSSPMSARLAGLEDYRVIVNVGPRGGQTVFHLHWHVLGGDSLPGFE